MSLSASRRSGVRALHPQGSATRCSPHHETNLLATGARGSQVTTNGSALTRASRTALATVRTRQLCLLCQAHTAFFTRGASGSCVRQVSRELARSLCSWMTRPAQVQATRPLASLLQQTRSALVADLCHLPHVLSFGVLVRATALRQPRLREPRPPESVAFEPSGPATCHLRSCLDCGEGVPHRSRTSTT